MMLLNIFLKNAHTRARKYADATNGLFSADEVKAQIIEKRNKDLLMAYGLIPLSKSGKITKTAQKKCSSVIYSFSNSTKKVKIWLTKTI